MHKKVKAASKKLEVALAVIYYGLSHHTL